MSRRWLVCGIVLAAIAVACACMAVVVERPVAARLQARTFPSVLQAWNGVGQGTHDEAAATLSRHDLVFHGPEFFGLAGEGDFLGLATRFAPASRSLATARRKQLRLGNPHMILLAEVRYRDAPSSWLQENHAWWKRENGQRAAGWEEGAFYKLDLTNPDYRRHVARQAVALMETGAVDGIMLDWWTDDDHHVALVTEIRSAIGEKPLILVNANCPLPTPDHLHDWCPLWDIDLGRPLAAAERDPDGTLRRRFDHGLAVYNPPGNRPATVTFPIVHRSAATGAGDRTFRLAGGDGDCYLGR